MRGPVLLSIASLALLWSAPSAPAAPDLATKLEAPQGKDFDAKLAWYADHCLAWAREHEAEGDALRAAGREQEALAAYHAALGEAGVMALHAGWEVAKDPGGLRVTVVNAGGDAERAGVRVGDLLVAIDGRAVAGWGDFKFRYLLAMLDTVPLRPVRLTLRRDGASIELALDRRPGSKWCKGVAESGYLLALERKLVDFLAASGRRPTVNDNMRWAAGVAARTLGAARSAAEKDEARGDLLATTLATVGWSDFYLNCGVLLEAAGDATGAERCYRNFVQLAPADPQAVAVAARFAALEPLVRQEAERKAFEGWWAAYRDGRRQSSGFKLERQGALIGATSLAGVRWLRGSIVDGARAEVVQTLTGAATGGRLGALIERCFGGVLEGAGTLTLSSDKQRLTLVVANDIDIDPATCAIVRRNPSTAEYVR